MKDYKKKLAKDVKILLKKKKKKGSNMVVNIKKISQRMKNKSFLSIEKSKNEKKLIQNEKKRFIKKSNDLESSFGAYLNKDFESVCKNG